MKNFHQVSDCLYRSDQPSKDDFSHIMEIGIKSIVNLRSLHTDWFKIHNMEFKYFHIWMKAWHAEIEDIRKFLKIVRDQTNWPVLVHCLHGSDRTGTMVAMYRIVIQDWSKKDAINEMTQGGFGFHGIFRNLVDWIYSVDLNKLNIGV